MKHDDDIYWDRVIGGLILVMGCLIIGVLLNRLVAIDWHPKPHAEAITIVPTKPIHIPKPMEWPPTVTTDGLMLDLNWYPTPEPASVTNATWWQSEPQELPPQWGNRQAPAAQPAIKRKDKAHARHAGKRPRIASARITWTDGRDTGPAPTGRR